MMYRPKMISRTRRIRFKAEKVKFQTKTKTGGDPLKESLSLDFSVGFFEIQRRVKSVDS